MLMSVYGKEKPEYLQASMESMFDQTVPPDDFVLVCDGPLTEELDEVISRLQVKYEILHVIRLSENRGLANALNVGITACKCELIARMDSDDIARPYRCEKEIEILNDRPEICVVGGLIEEFHDEKERVDSVRVVPENNEEIIKFARIRSPFNHVTVMYRKTSVLAAGGYPQVRYMQDYYLWINMILSGYQGYNIQMPLVWVRADDNQFLRKCMITSSLHGLGIVHQCFFGFVQASYQVLSEK